MPAAYSNLLMEQGATFNATITIDDVYGVTYNLAGFTASSQMRKSYYSSNATATFTSSISVSAGTISLDMAANTTANISPGRYVYDVLTISPANVYSRIIEGIITITPRVTR